MGSYSRSQGAGFASGPSGSSSFLYAQDERDGAQNQHSSLSRTTNAGSQSAVGPTRLCSVRGCTNTLPLDYALKMCEVCRGRHRIYASTKRAKRKMEKMAIGAQSGHVVWMPPDEENEVAPSSSKQRSASPESPPTQRPQPPSPYASTGPTWDINALDPRLFAQNSSSELAGALILPPSPNQEPPMPLEGRARSRYTLSAVASSSRSSGPSQTHVVTPPSGAPFTPTAGPSTLHTADTSPLNMSEAAAQLDASPLPPRYCSIKGCKALISGNSFFKMCEPCRDRYRSYGTTKRAKWKREKEVAVAELEKLRGEEDQRRADEGLPPLSDPGTRIEWSDYSRDPSTSSSHPPVTVRPYPSHAPRMCTVSHCREILPGDYEYLRCERHRIQNRHHSKLKRVRDKETKAIAFDEWSSAMGVRPGEGGQGSYKDDSHSSGENEEDEDEDDYGSQLGMNSIPDVQTTLLGEPATGVPPAARGTRRTNHVCSIKVCYNLLSPSNPWKMCDSCRARDRTARRIKALRESGVPVEPLPPRIRSTVKAEGDGEAKAKKKKKKKKVPGDTDAVDVEAGNGAVPPANQNSSAQMQPDTAQDATSMAGSSERQPPSLIFMEPLLPQEPLLPESSTSSAGVFGNVPLSFVMADATGNITEPSRTPIAAPESMVASKAPAQHSTEESLIPPETATKKRGAKRKGKGKASVAHPPTTEPAVPPMASLLPPTSNASGSISGAAASSVPSNTVSPANAAPLSAPATAPNAGTQTQPPYHVPYYMPPPYGMPPYPPGVRYPYSSINPYGPSPYQPPYSYPPPYPYPQHYGQPYPPQTYAPPPPPPPPAPPPQPPPEPAQQPPPPASMFSMFSSRPTDANGKKVVANSQSSTAPAEQSALSFTFSLRTGEPYSRNAPTQPRRKRLLPEQIAAEAAKRANRESTATPGGGLNTTHASATSGTQVTAETNRSAQAAERGQPCGNPSCHRSLPADATGTLCDKCKERLKKRQLKAKQRYKLEPRKLVGRGSGSKDVSHSGTPGERVNGADVQDVGCENVYAA